MSEKLTDVQKKAYLEAKGVFCPYCLDIGVEYIGKPELFDNTQVSWTTKCRECRVCNAKWRDIFSLTDVQGQD